MSDRTVRVGDQKITIVDTKSPIYKFEGAGERTVGVSGQKLGSINFIPGESYQFVCHHVVSCHTIC